MFKRATWAAAGYAAGIASSVVAVRKAKALARKATPRAVLDRTQIRIERTRSQVRGALADGRDAASRRELELKNQIDRTHRQNVQ
jgi:hypothetical protein